MIRIWTIAKREFVEGLRNRAFLLGAVLTPAILVGSLFLPTGLAEKLKPDRAAIAVSGGDRPLVEELERRVALYNERGVRPRYDVERLDGGLEAALEKAKPRLASGDLAVLLYLGDRLIEGDGTISLYYHTAGIAGAPKDLGRWAGDSVRRRRLVLSGARPEAIAKLDAPVKLDTKIFGDRGQVSVEEAVVARILVPVAAAMLLFIGIFSVSQLCLTNLIEERSGRVLEVLLASVSPLELMAGKILGNGMLGLAVCGFWAMLGVHVARGHGLAQTITPLQFVLLPTYFVLGFLLFAAFYCAAGSICETVKGAQALMLPLTLTATVPLMLGGTIAHNQSTGLARALSLVPPMTPFAMMFRLALPPGPSPLDIALSLASLTLGVAGAVWAASRIFRVGILLHGRAPGPREVWRWVSSRN
ncbi:MAG: ABC transporter permease [Elusimicrobia bacterium]|nr:ABC transporter permease [Elusimicrobiota bacterium]